MSSYNELSSDASSLSNVESLQSVRDVEGSFNSIVQSYQVEPINCIIHCRCGRTMREGGSGGRQDDEDCIRFATLESRSKTRIQSVIG